jgi:hypothetical protein
MQGKQRTGEIDCPSKTILFLSIVKYSQGFLNILQYTNQMPSQYMTNTDHEPRTICNNHILLW